MAWSTLLAIGGPLLAAGAVIEAVRRLRSDVRDLTTRMLSVELELHRLVGRLD